MSIICLEGASAVGNTICNLMEEKFSYIRIPEVNELFIRQKSEGKNWYLKLKGQSQLTLV